MEPVTLVGRYVCLVCALAERISPDAPRQTSSFSPPETRLKRTTFALVVYQASFDSCFTSLRCYSLFMVFRGKPSKACLPCRRRRIKVSSSSTSHSFSNMLKGDFSSVISAFQNVVAVNEVAWPAAAIVTLARFDLSIIHSSLMLLKKEIQVWKQITLI